MSETNTNAKNNFVNISRPPQVPFCQGDHYPEVRWPDTNGELAAVPKGTDINNRGLSAAT